MKKLLYAILILSAIGLPVVGYFVFKNKDILPSIGRDYTTIQFVAEKPREMVVGAEFLVLSCRVYDGMTFNVSLENRQNCEIKLKSFIKEEATKEIIDILKTASNPSVILRRKIDNYWIVDFNLTIQGKRTTLIEWLGSKNLLL